MENNGEEYRDFGMDLNSLQELINPMTTMTAKLTRHEHIKGRKRANNFKSVQSKLIVEENDMMRLGYFLPALKKMTSINETKAFWPAISSPYTRITSPMHNNMVKEECALVGLRNKGQLCFMNSILQALVPLQTFILYLKLIQQRNELARSSTSIHFVNLLYDMLTSLAGVGSQTLLDATKILKVVGIKHPQFSSLLDQQDAQEFFQAVITIVSADAETCYSSLNLNPRYNPLFSTSSALWFLLHVPHPYDTMLASSSQTNETTFKEEKKDHDEACSIKMKQQPSHSRSIQILLSSTSPSFTGWTGSMLKCTTCKHTKAIQNTPFYDIPVLPSSSTITESLHHFFNTECITNVECYNCTIQAQIKTHNQELQSLNRVIKKRQLRYGSHESHHYDGLLQERQSCVDKIHKLQSIDPENDEKQHGQVMIKSHAYKSLFISRLPPVLILHIQRKYYNPKLSNMIKSTKHISFPQIIDVSPFMAVSTNNKILYQLKSVVEHIGNANNGHYQTFRRCSENNKWIRCSDETIEYVTWDRVKLVQAYMLFYEAL